MKKSRKKTLRVVSLALALICLCGCLVSLSACKKDVTGIKIGVLREDASSGEASAWEAYLKTLAKDYGFEIDFTTTKSAEEELSAIEGYAKKDYRAILLFSDGDVVSAVNAAAQHRMYVVCPAGQPSDEVYEKIKNNEFFLGAVGPDDNTEFAAGYAMAKYFAEELTQSTFTLYGGAAGEGVTMHAERLAGMLSYLCEDEGTDYDGVKTRKALVERIAADGVDPAKFHSEKYAVTGYLDGFAFDGDFSARLAESMDAGGTCILAVGAGDTLSELAHKITAAKEEFAFFLCGGVDAIVEDYAESFDKGYSYDCGKYPSILAPAVILTLRALEGNKLLDDDGMAPRIATHYWTATSKAALNILLEADNATDGYCYNKAVIDRYLDAPYSELVALAAADHAGAVAIHESCNG